MKVTRYYASDLTDRQWQVIRQLLPPPCRRGRRPICRRRVINAILYVVRTGCQWRMLPSSFPNWSTVYGIFWRCGLRSGEPAGLCQGHLRLDSANDPASGRAEGLRGVAKTLDCRTHLRLARSLPPSQQGLRKNHGIQ